MNETKKYKLYIISAGAFTPQAMKSNSNFLRNQKYILKIKLRYNLDLSILCEH